MLVEHCSFRNKQNWNQHCVIPGVGSLFSRRHLPYCHEMMFSLKVCNLHCFHEQFYFNIRPSFHPPLENTHVITIIRLDVCLREACVSQHKKQSRIIKCMDKWYCVKSLCDGYDVQSDKYREFKRERKVCLQDDKLYRKKKILERKRGVSYQSKK